MRVHQHRRRCNTDHNLSERRSEKIQNIHLKDQQNSYDQGSYRQSQNNNQQTLFELINYENDIKSHYTTDRIQEKQTKGQSISHRIKYLMKNIKESIKELCLTRHAVVQVQEELGKIYVYFSDTVSSNPKCQLGNHQNSSLSNVSEIRIKANHQFLQKSSNNYDLTDQMPATIFFRKFLQGTVHQDISSLCKSKLNSYQSQLVEEFMEKYMFLLQKQINRISKYNGEKKLKYLLQTVMKQIFVQIMRFSYQTKVELFKLKNKNILNFASTKVNILHSTISRIISSRGYASFGFNAIKLFTSVQIKADIQFVNNFEYRVHYLNNLLKIKQRKQIREKFLQWRKTSLINKKVQKEQIYNEVNFMIKQILHQFAQNEQNIDKWKLIILSRINEFIKKVCKFGQTLLIPVQQGQYQQYFDTQKSLLNSKRSTLRQMVDDYESYRYSRSSQSYAGSPQQSEVQRNIFSVIRQSFTSEQIKNCLKNGEIIMSHAEQNIILIPVQCMSGVVGFRYNRCHQFNQNSSQEKYGNQINASHFYNILSALEICSPMIIQLMQIKQKFQYFQNKIQKFSFHKFILNNSLEIQNQNFQQKQKQNTKQQQKKTISKNIYSIHSDLPSITHRSYDKKALIPFQQKNQYIDNSLFQIGIQKLFMYHKNMDTLNVCLQYTVGENSFLGEKVIGKDIIQTIFTQLQKINKFTFGNQPKFLLLKKQTFILYAYPLFNNDRITGFVEIHVNQENQLFSDLKNYPSSSLNSFYVTPIDSKRQKLSQTLYMIVQGLIPLLMQSKCNNELKIKNSLKQCVICKTQKYTVVVEQENKNFNQKITQKVQNMFQMNQISQIFLKFSSNISGNQCMLKLQKQIFRMINKKAKQNTIYRKNKQQKSSKIPQYGLQNIQNKMFMRIFYKKTPISKDNRMFSLQKDTTTFQSNTKFQFYHMEFPEKQVCDLKSYLQITFIDYLTLFSTQNNSQSFEISVQKLIEIYKQMSRKRPVQEKQQRKQNDYEVFVKEILKSILLRQQVESLLNQKKYHSLQLLLYQLKDFNKVQDQLKIKFIVNIYPIFSYLDNKNRYLTALVCSGQFIFQSSEQNIEEDFSNKKQSILKHLIEQSGNRFLGKLIELNVKSQKLAKIKINELALQNKTQQKQINFKQILNTNQVLTQDQQDHLLIYSRGQKFITNFMSAITKLQSELILTSKIKVKTIIIQKFHQKYISKKQNILQSMVKVIQKHVKNNKLTTKKDLVNLFIKMSNTFIIQKSKHYLTYSVLFQAKMTRIFVINKFLKKGFTKIKQIQIENNYLLSQTSETNINTLVIPKKFAVQRINNILKNKLFSKSNQKEPINSNIHTAFERIYYFSEFQNSLRALQKHQSLYILQNALHKLVCKSAYIPYFIQLQTLQKSLFQSISLIGTEIEFINFHSFYQFLKFLNQRISIIVKGQKRLIGILYGRDIEKINIFMKIQNKNNKDITQITLTDTEDGTLINRRNNFLMQTQNITCQISVFQNCANNIYLGFQFVEEQCEQINNFKNRSSLKNFALILKKVFQESIFKAFQKFYSLYQDKLKAFSLKVSRVLKIKSYICKTTKNLNNIPEQEMRLKKYVLRKLDNDFMKCQKFIKNVKLNKEVQRKSKQLEQLENIYQKRAKLLVSNQLNSKDNETKNGQNSHQEGQFSRIVTKGMIKTLKQNIENLDLNSESLSIQYQIKSKTVAGHQIMSIVNQRQRKQTMEYVASHILQKNRTPLEQSKLSSYYCINSNQNESERTQQGYLSEDMVLQQKQKLNYLKAFYNQQKNMYDDKFKKNGIRSVAKIVKNINKSTFKRAFYQINSFSCLNSPLQTIR